MRNIWKTKRHAEYSHSCGARTTAIPSEKYIKLLQHAPKTSSLLCSQVKRSPWTGCADACAAADVITEEAEDITEAAEEILDEADAVTL